MSGWHGTDSRSAPAADRVARRARRRLGASVGGVGAVEEAADLLRDGPGVGVQQGGVGPVPRFAGRANRARARRRPGRVGRPPRRPPGRSGVTRRATAPHSRRPPRGPRSEGRPRSSSRARRPPRRSREPSGPGRATGASRAARSGIEQAAHREVRGGHGGGDRVEHQAGLAREPLGGALGAVERLRRDQVEHAVGEDQVPSGRASPAPRREHRAGGRPARRARSDDGRTAPPSFTAYVYRTPPSVFTAAWSW